MPARKFQAFKKVFTPRTPDTGYDSLGVFPPLAPIVMTPLITDVYFDPVSQTFKIQSLGTGIILQNAIYYAGVAACSATETIGSSVKLQSATYSPPPPIP